MIDEGAFYAQLGARIAEARSDRQMTQSDLARQVPLSRTSVTNIENGLQKVSVLGCLQIARALKKDLDDLLPELGRLKAEAVEKLVADLPENQQQFVRVGLAEAIGQYGE